MTPLTNHKPHNTSEIKNSSSQLDAIKIALNAFKFFFLEQTCVIEKLVRGCETLWFLWKRYLIGIHQWTSWTNTHTERKIKIKINITNLKNFWLWQNNSILSPNHLQLCLSLKANPCNDEKTKIPEPNLILWYH